MSRTNFLDGAKSQNLVPPSALKALIESYIVNKQNEADFKKAASAENTQIKALMTENKLTEYATDLGTAKLVEKHHKDFDEDKLIEFLKSNNVADGIVKTKEYVDMDALESAMYHETISADLQKKMATCQTDKVVVELRISKAKGV